MREAVVVLALTEKLTAPLPEPLAPEVILSHGVLLLTALHVQPEVAVTVTVLVPPAAAMVWVVGLIA